MSALVDALQKGQVTGDYTLAAVLDGPEAGSRMLLRGGRPVWQTHSSGVLQRSLSRLQECTATGFLELDGTRVFVERFGAVPQIVVCGGGHVAASVVRLAKLLGLPVLAMEDRTEYAQDLRDAGADTVFCLPFAQALEQVPGGAETYFVVVTRAHAFDVACLEQILQKPAAYVGMMGSRGRAALVRRQLLEAGADVARVEAVQAPIGLAIGAKTAEEIALSILAQIVEVKNARPQTEGFAPALLAAMEQAAQNGQPAVLATIIARHGSTPREVGSKMLLLPDGTTGRALAHAGQDGLALLIQRLFHHGVGSILLFDLFLRQLDDAEGRKGRQPFLVFGHALGEVFCVQFAHTDQVNVLHFILLTASSSARLRPRRG